MKKFLIKVNGNQYDVEVEEVISENVTQSVAPISTPVVNTAAPIAPVAQPSVPASKPSESNSAKASTVSGAVGSNTIKAPMPGTILSVNVNAGDSVKKGQVLLILEAMKMENELTSPVDGTVATVNVKKGYSVNAGDILVSIN